HDQMPQPPHAGHEAPVRAAWREGTGHPFLTMEHLMLVADRVTKTEHSLDATLLAQGRIAHGDFHAVFLESGKRRLELDLSLGLPADVGQAIDLAGMEGKPVPPIVRAEVERVRI